MPLRCVRVECRRSLWRPFSAPSRSRSPARWPRAAVQATPRHAPPRHGVEFSPEEIHIVRFDINGTTPAARNKRAKQYKDGTRRRIQRAKAIGPLLYYNKPVTPVCNPENPKASAKGSNPLKPETWCYDPKSGHSYHVVEMVDTGGNSGMKVQLLICDYNQYLVAFRRERNGVWSSWYHWKDWRLPDHFNGVDLGINGDHEIKSTIGGNQCLDDMFYGLALYPEQLNKERVRKALLRAVVLFCEAIRLRIIFDEMVRRLGLIMDPIPLTGYMWEQIGAWGNLCELALQCAKKRGLVNEAKLRSLIKDGKMKNFNMLIAADQSELMLLMRHEPSLLPKGQNLSRKEATAVRDPGFPAPGAGMA